MQSKLFVSDLDKTLLTSKGEITDATRNAWNYMINQGVKLTVATARSAGRVREMLTGLLCPWPIIVLNGAMMLDADGSFRHIKSMTEHQVLEIIGFGKELGHRGFLMGVHEGREVLAHTKPETLHEKKFISERWGDDPRRQSVVALQPVEHTQLVQFVGDMTAMQTLHAQLLAHFQNTLDIKFSEDVYFTGSFCVELQHTHADKATALAQLGLDLNIPSSEWMVFGDNMNDIGMFNQAGISVAVNNAVPAAKQAADMVLEHSNDEDAVVRHLLSYFGIDHAIFFG